ncbi:hypothetical protein CEXT_88361 [Caerostris extrusa]|uniref:Uncharacterized protein n=1 Tax=Caerostris extrusa TaxID=172846 RepID=A0AAV4ME87_CAEEX|nr:hypothetical protein CEXT_88361 [Caerostris extrusa]
MPARATLALPFMPRPILPCHTYPGHQNTNPPREKYKLTGDPSQNQCHHSITRESYLRSTQFPSSGHPVPPPHSEGQNDLRMGPSNFDFVFNSLRGDPSQNQCHHSITRESYLRPTQFPSSGHSVRPPHSEGVRGGICCFEVALCVHFGFGSCPEDSPSINAKATNHRTRANSFGSFWCYDSLMS